jgi:hypothetical protein
MKTHRDVNEDILKSLGIDSDYVTSCVITLSENTFPLVRVKFNVVHSDKISRELKEYSLIPIKNDDDTKLPRSTKK